MNKINKIGIISCALMGSFLMFAQDNSESNQKTTIEEIEEILKVSNTDNFANSLEKSRLRNESSALDLRDQLISREINIRNKLLELRRLDYLLDLPVETQIDTSRLNLSVLEERPTGFQIKDDSMSFRRFEPSTYEADQLIFSERERRKEEEDSLEGDGASNNTNNRGQNINNNSGANFVERRPSRTNLMTIPEAPVFSLNELRGNRSNTNPDLVDGGVQDGLPQISEEELEILGITREEYNSWMNPATEIANLDSETAEVSKEPEPEPEPEEFLEITNVGISTILIFGERRRADIVLTIYVGDGIAGASETKIYRNLSQGDLISYEDYTIRVVRITQNQVEVEVVETGNRYSGTSTYN